MTDDFEPLTLGEIERTLAEIIRDKRTGMIGAIKIWLELHPPDGPGGADDPFAEFDAVLS